MKTFVRRETVDIGTEDIAGMVSNAEASQRRYLCERCGGTGKQPAGCWDREAKSYTAKAGTCETCGGSGYLGPVVKSDWSDAGRGKTEHGDVSLLVAQLSRGLDLLSPTTGNPEKDYQRFLSLMKLEAKIKQLMQQYPHSADELGE